MKDFWKQEDFKNTKYNYILIEVIEYWGLTYALLQV